MKVHLIAGQIPGNVFGIRTRCGGLCELSLAPARDMGRIHRAGNVEVTRDPSVVTCRSCKKCLT